MQEWNNRYAIEAHHDDYLFALLTVHDLTVDAADGAHDRRDQWSPLLLAQERVQVDDAEATRVGYRCYFGALLWTHRAPIKFRDKAFAHHVHVTILEKLEAANVHLLVCGRG